MLSGADNFILLLVISSLYYMYRTLKVSGVNGNVLFKMMSKGLKCQIIELIPETGLF